VGPTFDAGADTVKGLLTDNPAAAALNAFVQASEDLLSSHQLGDSGAIRASIDNRR